MADVCGHDVLVVGRSTRHHTPPPTPYYWVPFPLSLKHKRNVLCQTQHIWHILRGLITPLLVAPDSFLDQSIPQVTTRYVDLQPVGMGPSFFSLSVHSDLVI